MKRGEGFVRLKEAWNVLLAACCLSAGTAVAAPAGQLGYFEPSALKRVDRTAVRGDVAAALGRCAEAFAEAEAVAGGRTGRARDMILKRLEIGRRLEAYVRERADADSQELELMAWQGAQELKSLFGYFAAERRRDERRDSRQQPVVASLADFQTDGRGTNDCAEAFRRAFSFAKAQNGRPVVLKIPAGVWLVRPAQEEQPKNVVFRSYRDYDENGLPRLLERPRPWKDYGEGFHLTCHGLSSLTIEGEQGAEIRFADSRIGGIGFFGCTETVLKNVSVSYRDNPSTQGVIVSVDTNGVGFVFRRDPGFPDPDDPRFLGAHSRRFTVHREDGLVGAAGTGRMGAVERLAADTFLFRPPPHMKSASVWTSRRPGERLVVIARYSEKAKGFPVSWKLCSFSGAENVRIYDSPGQSFWMSSSYALWLLDCEVTVRPGSDDLLGSNADGLIASGPIGPYVDGCSFSHMEDDGFNIGTEANVLTDVSPDHLRCAPDVDGVGAFQVDGVTGRVKAVLRRDPRTGKIPPLPPETVSKAMLDGGVAKDFDMRAWLSSNSWAGVRGERKPDRLLRVPGTVGAVVRNTRLADLRGMGIQVHCADMLVENVSVEHVTGPAMTIAPLFGWGMLFDVHNVLVRNCTFADCRTGIVAVPGCVQPGQKLVQKMIHAIDLVDNAFSLPEGEPALLARNAHAVHVGNSRFWLRLKRDAAAADAVTVTSDVADEVRMAIEPDGTEVITYSYRDGSPVVKAVVRVARGVAPEGKGRSIRVEVARGWILEKTCFPACGLPQR